MTQEETFAECYRAVSDFQIHTRNFDDAKFILMSFNNYHNLVAHFIHMSSIHGDIDKFMGCKIIRSNDVGVNEIKVFI